MPDNLINETIADSQPFELVRLTTRDGGDFSCRASDITLILEWIPRRSNNKTTLELYELLTSFGYRPYRIGSEGLRPIDSPRAFHGEHAELWEGGHCDVLCSKTELPWSLLRRHD